MDLREKFLQNGIPYDDIDEYMIPIIDVLNFKCNLKTQYCCWGHVNEKYSFYFNEITLMFDQCVTDQEIHDLMYYLEDNKFGSIYFKKFSRFLSKKLSENWTFESAMTWDEENKKGKIAWRDKFVELLSNYKK
jgi:hypothetical protein